MAQNTTQPETEEDWIACLPLPEYIAKIPAGHIVPIVGDEIWIDGKGDRYSTKEYIDKWGFDPAKPWAAIKAYRAAQGQEKKVIKLSHYSF